jgi:molybdate/tungstate transport system permease protein
MPTDADARFGAEFVGRRALVAAVLAGQGLAFAATYAAGRPTLYAYVVVLSAMGAAFVVESDGAAPRATLRFLAVQAVVLVVAYAAGSLLGALLGTTVSGLGHPFRYLSYVVLGTAAAVASVEDGGFTVGAAAVGSVLVVVLGLPLFMFVARQSPAMVVQKATDPEVHRMLYLGVYGPLIAALLSLLFGVPLAYLLAEGFPGQPFVESLVDLPLVVPHSVAGIIVLFGFGRSGAFPGYSVLGSMIGIVLAMAFVSAPYAVNATREAFETIDDRLAYASRIHGASEWETFRRVTGPLALRGMVTGGVLAWARAVSEFGAVAVVAYSVSFFYPPAGERVTSQHAPVFVYNTYLQGGLEESGAVAFLLLAVSALLFLVVRYLTDDGSPAGGVV